MTTLQLITSNHTTTHNTLQASIAVEDTYDYYYATDSFMVSLVSQIKAEGDIFAAMRRVEEINSLNGYKVVSDIHIRKIKKHFSKKKNQSRESQKVKNGIGQRQRGKQDENFTKDYQKAYMKMLSI